MNVNFMGKILIKWNLHGEILLKFISQCESFNLRKGDKLNIVKVAMTKELLINLLFFANFKQRCMMFVIAWEQAMISSVRYFWFVQSNYQIPSWQYRQVILQQRLDCHPVLQVSFYVKPNYFWLVTLTDVIFMIF